MKQESAVLGITKFEDRFRYTLTRPGEPFMGPLQRIWSVPIDHTIIAEYCKMMDKTIRDANTPPYMADILAAGRGLYDELLPDSDPDIKELRRYLCELQMPLVICTDAPEVYWELLYIEDIKEFIGLKYDIGRCLQTCYVPSRASRPDHDLRCLMIVDPNLNLPDSAQEASQLRDWLKNRNVNCDDYLEGKRATLNAVLNKLRNEYDFIHYTGHIVFEKDKCALVLNGGKLFTATSIKKHIKGTPIVFLNGCWGEGLTKAFLEGGAQVVIGSPFEVPENGARVFAERFYNCILNNKTVGEAMRVARRHVKDNVEYGATWACFIMYGDPCQRVKFEKNPRQKPRNDLKLYRNFEHSTLRDLKKVLSTSDIPDSIKKGLKILIDSQELKDRLVTKEDKIEILTEEQSMKMIKELKNKLKEFDRPTPIQGIIVELERIQKEIVQLVGREKKENSPIKIVKVIDELKGELEKLKRELEGKQINPPIQINVVLSQHQKAVTIEQIMLIIYSFIVTLILLLSGGGK